MTTAQMVPPAGVLSGTGQSGTSYTVDNNGVAVINQNDISSMLNAGWSFLKVGSHKVTIRAPLAADLVSVYAATTPANGSIFGSVNQPMHARKLQYRIVIGTTTTTAITAGTLTVTGTDQDGNAITEVVSLIENASATKKSAYAWSSITAAVIASYAANGSGTGNTIGIGVSNDFGVPTVPGSPSGLNLVCVKATKIITTWVSGTPAWSLVATDDVASTTTVDQIARSIAPTTAPGAGGINDYEFTYTFGIGA